MFAGKMELTDLSYSKLIREKILARSDDYSLFCLDYENVDLK